MVPRDTHLLEGPSPDPELASLPSWVTADDESREPSPEASVSVSGEVPESRRSRRRRTGPQEGAEETAVVEASPGETRVEVIGDDTLPGVGAVPPDASRPTSRRAATEALRRRRRSTTSEDDDPGAQPGTLPRAARWLPWLIALPFFIAYAALSIAKFETLGMASYDLAIFTQIVRSYSEFHAPIAEIKGVGYNALGDHFHPIVALIAPFYLLYKSAITLLVAQALLFALSVVVVSREGFKRFGTFAGVTCGLAYGLAWGIQSAVAFEFHEIAFAPLLMALALQALLNERWKTSMLWASMLLLVKEDLGLTVAMFGVVMFLRGKRLLGIAQTLIGAVGFVLVLKVFIPMANPNGQYDYTSRDDLGLSFHTAFLEGQHTKIWMLVWLFAITGFLALRSNIVLLVLPTLAWRFATSNENYWGTSWQYSAILMPIVFMAMYDAMTKMRRSKREWVRGWAAHNPAVTLVVAIMLLQQFPLNQLVRPETYTIPTRALAARQAAAHIPDGAVVESDNGILPYIVQRTRALFNGATGGIAPDFVVFDSAWGWAPPPEEAVQWAQDQHPPHTYTIVYSADTFTVLQRDDYQPPEGWTMPDWHTMP